MCFQPNVCSQRDGKMVTLSANKNKIHQNINDAEERFDGGNEQPVPLKVAAS